MDRRREDVALERIDPARRAFIRKLAVGTAFAVPLVASFSTGGLSLNSAQAGGLNSNMDEGEHGGLLSVIIRFIVRIIYRFKQI